MVVFSRLDYTVPVSEACENELSPIGKAERSVGVSYRISVMLRAMSSFQELLTSCKIPGIEGKMARRNFLLVRCLGALSLVQLWRWRTNYQFARSSVIASCLQLLFL